LGVVNVYIKTSSYNAGCFYFAVFENEISQNFYEIFREAEKWRKILNQFLL
jgi:hypothetical protein